MVAVIAYGSTTNGGAGDADTACNTGDLYEPANANAVVLLFLGTRPLSVDRDLQPDRFRGAAMITKASVRGSRAPADRVQVHVRFSSGATDGDLAAFVAHARQGAWVSEVNVGRCPLQ